MIDLLTHLISQIVDQPEQVQIEEKQEDQRFLYIIHAAQTDLGKIIGRGGRIIRAIRDLVKIKAAKLGIYADVVIAEENPESSKVA